MVCLLVTEWAPMLLATLVCCGLHCYAAYLLMMPYALIAFGYFLALPSASLPSACILTYTDKLFMS